MSSLVAYYTAASAGIIALSIIFQVNGQPTVEVSEKGDSSNIIVEEIHQLRVELLGQLNEAVLSMKDFINASSQQNLIRAQQDIYADNRRSQEQVQSFHEVINGSFLQMKTIIQAVGRCSQEHDVYTKQIQSIHRLLNETILHGYDISIINKTQIFRKRETGKVIQFLSRGALSFIY